MNAEFNLTDAPDYVAEPQAAYGNVSLNQSDIKSDNREIDLARMMIETTGTNLFLTGKAGTGKTTFLRNLRENSKKRMVVVAPTGIAAINAGGVTIHSFFQLDFNDVSEEVSRRKFVRFSKAKLNIIRSLDVLVIDEISMVRADLLDRIDKVLRRCRASRRPFGGAQLLMIGDLHQLPPVLTEAEAESVLSKYPTPYFFESLALKEAGFRTIELRKVYRQKDAHFLSLLNAIRTNRAGMQVMNELNSCVGKRLGGEVVRLVTHNSQARAINEGELSKLTGPIFTFSAKVEGKFPESSYPGEENLVLKKGAQVIFIKNDLVNHDWYNGLLGEVIDLSEEHIRVRSSEGNEITVRREEWVNNSYQLEEESGTIKEVREGAFSQYPLRLAWAITIHKSQGLTFDKAIIDATNAFAHGQTYVALSRCRTLEGLSLDRPLTPASIITDSAVERFMESQTSIPVSGSEVTNLSVLYSINLLKELFDFSSIVAGLDDLLRVVGLLPAQYSGLTGEVMNVRDRFHKEVIDVAGKFEGWLKHFAIGTPGVPAEERVRSGAGYFASRLGMVRQLITRLPSGILNKEVRKRLDTTVTTLKTEIYVKHGLLTSLETEPFTIDNFIRLKSRLQISAEKEGAGPKRRPQKAVKTEVEENTTDFYDVLKGWRLKKSKELGLPAFRIMSNNALKVVASELPLSLNELKSLPNIGEYISSKFGKELLNLVKIWKNQRG